MSLPGTIAITDYDWYEFLRRERHWDEVNFWTPSAHFSFRAPEFSPFLLKLKSPHNAIAGFGYFARYAPLPDWLAWECFGPGNGSATFEEMRSRLLSIRQRISYKGSEALPQIGCIVVVDVMFFKPEEWVPQPTDWPVRTLRPTRYDLAKGEGLRVWAECQERIRPVETKVPATALVGREARATYGEPTLVRPRLGQGAFRVSVTEAYGRACAVTGEHSLPALDAAHIRPLAKQGLHDVRNGLLLRADLHRLFDQGYLTVTEEHRLEVSRRLRIDYQNGRSYYPLHGSRISLPSCPGDTPDPELLKWHNEEVFVA